MPVEPVMEILCPKNAAIPWQIKIYKNDRKEFYSCVRTATWSAISDNCGDIEKAEKVGRQMLADMLAELEDLINA
jgi:hypothetical protein